MGRDSFHGAVRMYLFFPLSHSRSAAFGDTAVRPAAELPMGLIYFAEKNSYGSFPIFRALPHPKACGWREGGAKASTGQPRHEGRRSWGF